MTDYTKLIERLEDAAEEWAGYVEMDTAPETLPKSMAPHIAALQSAIEALQAENERLTVERDHAMQDSQHHSDKRLALQAKLDELQKQEPVGCGYVVKWEKGDTPSSYETGYAQVLGVPVYAAPKAQEPIQSFIASQESLTTEMQQVLNSMPYTSTEAPNHGITKGTP